MSAVDLVELLFKKGLLTDKVRNKLLAQIKNADKPVTPEKIAKALVKKGLIDDRTAKSAIAELEQGASETRDDLELIIEEDDLPDAEPVLVRPSLDDEELGFAELEDEKPLEPAPVPPVPTVPVEPDDETPVVDEIQDEFVEVTDGAEDEPIVAAGGTSRRRKKFRANRWDSPLMLVGSGALILLVALGGVLWFLMSRETAQEAYDSAEESYRNQAYIQAAAKYESFVERFGKDENASAARVKIVLCHIWNDVISSRWEDALTKVQQELPTIEQEEAFDTARGELASILPRIMRGFAERASEQEDSAEAQRYLDLAVATKKEIDNSSYLPTRFRRELEPRIAAIEKIMKTVERNINRDKELTKAIAAIHSAVERGDTGEAYRIRRELIQAYPELADHPKLNETINAITAKEMASVQPVSESLSVLTEDHPSSTDIRITVAARSGPDDTAELSPAAYVQTRGSLYALQASDGHLKWRRFVGFEASMNPVALGLSPDSDVVVIDARHREIVRVAATDGSAKWRIPCDGRLTQPVVDEERIVVGCSDQTSGKLFTIDSETGATMSGVSFPMPLAVAPLITSDRLVIQPGMHSSLFVLDAQSLECKDVVYIGHSHGTMEVTPIQVLDHVVVAENPAPNFSQLHVLAPDADNPGKYRPIGKPTRLDGRVVVPMIAQGKRLMVTTDRGAVEVFELDPASSASADPLTRIVTGVPASDEEVTPHFAFYLNGSLWVAGRDFSRYEIQTARGMLARKWIRHKGDRYVTPIQRVGNYLISGRRPEGKRGVTVSAIRVNESNDSGKPVWEIDLGVPPADEVFVQNAKLNIVTANGDLFRIGRDELKLNSIDQATARVLAARLPILDDSFELNKSQRVFVSSLSPDHIVLINDADTNPLSLISLAFDNDRPATAPIRYREGLIVPAQSGAVYYFDPTSGRPAAREFQPPLRPDQDTRWPRPVVVGEDVVLPDGNGNVYRLTLKTDPESHLSLVQQSQADFRPQGELAAIGQTVYGVSRGRTADEMIALQASDLTASQNRWAVDGRVNWGPTTAGNVVLFATDAGQLGCLDEQQNEVWKTTFEHGKITGAPTLDGSTILLSSIQGIVTRIDAKTGRELQTFDVGEPLGSGVVLYGSRMIVLGSDGTLHVFRMQQ